MYEKSLLIKKSSVDLMREIFSSCDEAKSYCFLLCKSYFDMSRQKIIVPQRTILSRGDYFLRRSITHKMADEFSRNAYFTFQQSFESNFMIICHGLAGEFSSLDDISDRNEAIWFKQSFKPRVIGSCDNKNVDSILFMIHDGSRVQLREFQHTSNDFKSIAVMVI